jgi:hypothetical protein
MSGKYSAEWWQKIAGARREIPEAREHSRGVDQATAARPAEDARERDPADVFGGSDRSSRVLKTKRGLVPIA